MHLFFEADFKVGAYEHLERRGVDFLDFFIENSRKSSPSLYLSILGKINDNLWIPVIDLDNGSRLPELKKKLTLNCVSFVVVNTSPSRYWVFMDEVQEFPKVIEMMKQYEDFCDPRYLSICEKNGKISLRGFIKDLYRPKVLLQEQYYSILFREFVQAIHEHFNSKMVSFLAILNFLRDNPRDTTEINRLFHTDLKKLEWQEKQKEEMLWGTL